MAYLLLFFGVTVAIAAIGFLVPMAHGDANVFGGMSAALVAILSVIGCSAFAWLVLTRRSTSTEVETFFSFLLFGGFLWAAGFSFRWLAAIVMCSAPFAPLPRRSSQWQRGFSLAPVCNLGEPRGAAATGAILRCTRRPAITNLVVAGGETLLSDHGRSRFQSASK